MCLLYDTVCLGLIWDSDQPPVDDIMAVVNNIGLTLQLSDVRNKYLRSMYDNTIAHIVTFSCDDPFLFHGILGLAWEWDCVHAHNIKYNS